VFDSIVSGIHNQHRPMIFTELISETSLREKSFFTGKNAPPGGRDPHLDDRDHFRPWAGPFRPSGTARRETAKGSEMLVRSRLTTAAVHFRRRLISCSTAVRGRRIRRD
jgi:hypothetical protein